MRFFFKRLKKGARKCQVPSRNILVLGAGELGLPMLRHLARRAKDVDGAKISVLLRASAVESGAPGNRKDIEGIRNLGIEIVDGDLVKSSIDELAAVFARYDTVIGCAGYAAGIDTPMKLARAALQARIPRYFPWQFGVDSTCRTTRSTRWAASTLR